jgi:hypothetical protein
MIWVMVAFFHYNISLSSSKKEKTIFQFAEAVAAFEE